MKFSVEFLSKKIPITRKLDELKKWCNIFHERKLTPQAEGGSLGNLSFRFRKGFIITASGLRLKKNLTDDCFVYVVSYNERKNLFFVYGSRNPSSESIMHYFIYKKRKDVNAVFHGHDERILKAGKRLGIPITTVELPYGTKELAIEVAKTLGKTHKFIIMKNHGFVSVGKTMEEAGNLAVRIQEKTLRLF